MAAVDLDTLNVSEGSELDLEVALKALKASVDTGMKKDHWIIDSGASTNMTGHKELFNTIEPMASTMVRLADNWSVQAVGKGTVTKQVRNGSKLNTCTFREVWYVPKLEKNLLSVPQMARMGAKVQFHGQKCAIRTPEGDLALTGQREDGLYLCSPQEML